MRWWIRESALILLGSPLVMTGKLLIQNVSVLYVPVTIHAPIFITLPEQIRHNTPV